MYRDRHIDLPEYHVITITRRTDGRGEEGWRVRVRGTGVAEDTRIYNSRNNRVRLYWAL